MFNEDSEFKLETVEIVEIGDTVQSNGRMLFKFYQHLHKADYVNHLNFRREVVLCLLKKDFTDDSSGSIPGARVGATGGGHHAILPMDIRTDGVGHINEPTSSGRCTVCHGSTRNKCRKCNVRLHFAHGKNCFDFYHLH